MKKSSDRQELFDEIKRLAEVAVFGTISETYRTCGNKRCRCHGPGPKHGPHLHVSYRGTDGKTTGYYVPKAAHNAVIEGVEAWKTLQRHLRELAEMNRQRFLAEARQIRKE